jgi:circadian clock protein KaiC
MSHSNQVREFLLTEHGIQLVDVCLGPEGVLTGSARRAQAARERTETAAREEEIARQRRELDLRRQVMEARVATLRSEFKMEEEQLERLLAEEGTSRERLAQERAEMVRSRQGGSPAPTGTGMDRTPTR